MSGHKCTPNMQTQVYVPDAHNVPTTQPRACSYVRRTRPCTLAGIRPNSQQSAPPSAVSWSHQQPKTDRQKTATLQRPYLCDRSYVGWLSLTDVHRSMHTRPATSHALFALLSLACALLLLVCTVLLAHAMLRVCVCSPYCAPCARPSRGDHLRPRDFLRLIKHLQNGGLAATYI
jgi:hypothetical protein